MKRFAFLSLLFFIYYVAGMYESPALPEIILLYGPALFLGEIRSCIFFRSSFCPCSWRGPPCC